MSIDPRAHGNEKSASDGCGYDPLTLEPRRADGKDKVASPPKVTHAQIIARIVDAQYIITGTMTLCILTLDNQIKVVGKSACVDPRNFDLKIGRELAHKDAINKCWPLFGFALAEEIHNEKIQTEKMVEFMKSSPMMYIEAAPAPPARIGDIGWAVKQMWNNQHVARHGWNGKSMYLGIQRPDDHSANTLPYIWMRTVQGDRVPWLASQTDLLACDWYVLG